MNSRILGLAALLLSLALVVGCQSHPTQAYTHMIIADTAYYVGGPQQSRPPEGTLPEGTLVNIIQEAGSYTLIASDSHVTAYVATSAIQPR